MNERDNFSSKLGIIAVIGQAFFSLSLGMGAPAAGPSLIFEALPQVFAQMPGGRWFRALFFLLVIVASITSMVTIYKIIMTCLLEKLHLSRHKATAIVVFAILTDSLINILGEGLWSHITLNGSSIFGFLDAITNNITIPLTGALTAIIATWFWKYKNMERELTSDGLYKSNLQGPIFFTLLKWIIPPLIIKKEAILNSFLLLIGF